MAVVLGMLALGVHVAHCGMSETPNPTTNYHSHSSSHTAVRDAMGECTNEGWRIAKPNILKKFFKYPNRDEYITKLICLSLHNDRDQTATDLCEALCRATRPWKNGGTHTWFTPVEPTLIRAFEGYDNVLASWMKHHINPYMVRFCTIHT